MSLTLKQIERIHPPLHTLASCPVFSKYQKHREALDFLYRFDVGLGSSPDNKHYKEIHHAASHQECQRNVPLLLKHLKNSKSQDLNLAPHIILNIRKYLISEAIIEEHKFHGVMIGNPSCCSRRPMA
jgi:hypothetical protein